MDTPRPRDARVCHEAELVFNSLRQEGFGDSETGFAIRGSTC